MALVKYNNNSLSAVTSTAGMPGGTMVLIKEQTASSSATISFVNGTSDVVLSSTYPIYLFKLINIHPSTEHDFSFQVSTNTGSSYGVNITSTYFQPSHNEADTVADLTYQSGADLAQSTSFQKLSKDKGNANDDNTCGEMYLFSPSSTTFVKHFISTSNMTYKQSSPHSVQKFVAGYINTTSAVDAVQFKMSSGNIDAGTFKLYGIKDS